MKMMKWNDAKKFINENDKIIYLWFGTEWCGDCKMMEPVINEVEKKYENNKNITFIKVDAEEANLFRKNSIYKVEKVPTHILLKNSKIKMIKYEYISEREIIENIEKLIYEK